MRAKQLKKFNLFKKRIKEYLYFYNNISDFSGKGSYIGLYEKGDNDPDYCFYIFEGSGKRLPCNNLNILNNIFAAKAATDLQIKMWAEGLAEGTFFKFEFETICDFHNLPDWIYNATIQQRNKITLNSLKEK